MHGAGYGEKGLCVGGWSGWARNEKKRLEMKVDLTEGVPFHRRVG
jgi:hypothetical protein